MIFQILAGILSAVVVLIIVVMAIILLYETQWQVRDYQKGELEDQREIERLNRTVDIADGKKKSSFAATQKQF